MKQFKTVILSRFVVTFTILLSSIGLIGILPASSSADPIYQATCTVSNVPSVVPNGTVIKPELTITNTGSATISPHMISFVAVPDGSTTYFKDKVFGSIAPGASKTKTLGKYKVDSTSINQDEVYSHSDLNYSGTKVFFQCYQNFTEN
jgi:hypothetical protein